MKKTVLSGLVSASLLGGCPTVGIPTKMDQKVPSNLSSPTSTPTPMPIVTPSHITGKFLVDVEKVVKNGAFTVTPEKVSPSPSTSHYSYSSGGSSSNNGGPTWSPSTSPTATPTATITPSSSSTPTPSPSFSSIPSSVPTPEVSPVVPKEKLPESGSVMNDSGKMIDSDTKSGITAELYSRNAIDGNVNVEVVTDSSFTITISPNLKSGEKLYAFSVAAEGSKWFRGSVEVISSSQYSGVANLTLPVAQYKRYALGINLMISVELPNGDIENRFLTNINQEAFNGLDGGIYIKK